MSFVSVCVLSILYLSEGENLVPTLFLRSDVVEDRQEGRGKGFDK